MRATGTATAAAVAGCFGDGTTGDSGDGNADTGDGNADAGDADGGEGA
ncbi:thiamine ABC transporter substrate-binding protein, partial [Halorubrum sp. CBA1125]|nr:thiamine ABC transporter substrate-binding protein [Halorubrum sp. CBA1125]